MFVSWTRRWKIGNERWREKRWINQTIKSQIKSSLWYSTPPNRYYAIFDWEKILKSFLFGFDFPFILFQLFAFYTLLLFYWLKSLSPANCCCCCCLNSIFLCMSLLFAFYASPKPFFPSFTSLAHAHRVRNRYIARKRMQNHFGWYNNKQLKKKLPNRKEKGEAR